MVYYYIDVSGDDLGEIHEDTIITVDFIAENPEYDIEPDEIYGAIELVDSQNTYIDTIGMINGVITDYYHDTFSFDFSLIFDELPIGTYKIIYTGDSNISYNLTKNRSTETTVSISNNSITLEETATITLNLSKWTNPSTYFNNEKNEWKVILENGENYIEIPVNNCTLINDSITVTVEPSIFDGQTKRGTYSISFINDIKFLSEENLATLTITQPTWALTDTKYILNNNKFVKKIEDMTNDKLLYAPSEIILWKPLLNGENGGTYRYSYSESNGEAVGKGFVLNNGWDNLDEWEVTFQFKHDNIKYTGICFLAELNTYNGNGGSDTALTTWEGGWPNGTAYASSGSGTINYFDIKVTKIDSTHVRLRSTSLNKDTTVELSWLPNAEKLTIGARHNPASESYGPCRIKNVKVVIPI